METTQTQQTATQAQQTTPQATVQSQATTQAQPQPQVQQQTETKLFTQEQVNSIVSERLNAMKTNYNELNTQYNNLSSQMTSAIKELQDYKNKELVSKAGVKAQFADFVLFEANKAVTNEKGIADAIADFVKNNPYVKDTVETKSTGFQGKNEVDTAISSDVDAFLKQKGLKK